MTPDEEIQWFRAMEQAGGLDQLSKEDRQWWDAYKAAESGQQTQAASPEPVTGGDVAVDVAKSGGVGIGQGLLGLATTVGNLEGLGRSGINWAGRKLGATEDVVDPQPYFMDYNTLKRGIERDITGEFYKPKTTAGEYARTAGEFAPMAVAPGSAARRLLNVAAPAVGAETAGQLTKGSAAEPYARLAGGVVGGMAPGVASRMVSPYGRTAARDATTPAINELEAFGVTELTAGQRTGSNRLRQFEDATKQIPLGGTAYNDRARRAAEQYTEAALRQAGGRAGEARATPDVVNAIAGRLGAQYDQFAAFSRVNATQPFVGRLQRIVDDYTRSTPQGMHVPLIGSVVQDLTQRAQPAMLAGGRQGMVLSGPEFQSFYSSLRRAQRGLKSNPEASRALGQIIEAINTQMVRSAPRSQRAALARDMRTLNTQYRNFMAVEDAAGRAPGQWAAEGLISPPSLKAAVKKQNPRDYTRGRTPMSRLARAGEAVLRPLPSSGTAERNFALGVLQSPASAMSSGLAGFGLFGPAGAVAALGPAAGTAATARTLMSNPVQRYLANQVIPERWANVPVAPQGAFVPWRLTQDDEEQR